MDANELRKSIRKKKLETHGLTLSTLSLATTQGGTGTSDDEEEAVTPNGENTYGSLTSAFGGSGEIMPQETNFLQSAIEGPGKKGGNSKFIFFLFIIFYLNEQCFFLQKAETVSVQFIIMRGKRLVRFQDHTPNPKKMN